MKAGLVGLERAGLLQKARGGHVLTEEGEALTDSLSTLVASGSLTLAVSGPDGEVGADHVSIFRGIDSIWIGTWHDLAPADASVRLFRPSKATAIRLVQALLDPLPATPATPARPAAPSPARPVRSDAPPPKPTATRSRPAPAAPAPAPAPAAASSVPDAPAAPARRTRRPRTWVPTHRAPHKGMRAWDEPDASGPVVARLDPDLEVQVIEDDGAWAHIVCSNGWMAWVDGRELQDIE
jgi:hypothetical protein